jgi:hypothetical protein
MLPVVFFDTLGVSTVSLNNSHIQTHTMSASMAICLTRCRAVSLLYRGSRFTVSRICILLVFYTYHEIRNGQGVMHIYGISRFHTVLLCTFYLGRVLNRFSRDTGNMDELLPLIAIDVIMVSIILIMDSDNSTV